VTATPISTLRTVAFTLQVRHAVTGTPLPTLHATLVPPTPWWWALDVSPGFVAVHALLEYQSPGDHPIVRLSLGDPLLALMVVDPTVELTLTAPEAIHEFVPVPQTVTVDLVDDTGTPRTGRTVRVKPSVVPPYRCPRSQGLRALTGARVGPGPPPTPRSTSMSTAQSSPATRSTPTESTHDCARSVPRETQEDAVTTYLAPGVYVEEIPAGPQPIAPATTSVVAVVGSTRRGPVRQPTRVNSWSDFQRMFGGNSGSGFTAEAVYGFFENGGPAAYLVRVDPSVAGSWQVKDSTDANSFLVNATSPGSWAGDLAVSVAPDRTAGAAHLFRTKVKAAVTFTGADTQTVQVESTAGVAVGDTVVLLAADNGVGTELQPRARDRQPVRRLRLPVGEELG
jgi:hypothetical protein